MENNNNNNVRLPSPIPEVINQDQRLNEINTAENRRPPEISFYVGDSRFATRARDNFRSNNNNSYRSSRRTSIVTEYERILRYASHHRQVPLTTPQERLNNQIYVAARKKRFTNSSVYNSIRRFHSALTNRRARQQKHCRKNLVSNRLANRVKRGQKRQALKRRKPKPRRQQNVNATEN